MSKSEMKYQGTVIFVAIIICATAFGVTRLFIRQMAETAKQQTPALNVTINSSLSGSKQATAKVTVLRNGEVLIDGKRAN
jgi:hypothetical protein